VRCPWCAVSLEEATEPSDTFDSIPHPEFIADWLQSPEHLVEQNEVRRLLDDALTRLDEKHRLVFLLRDVEGLSVRETADALDLSEGNVKVRLLRARLQLRATAIRFWRPGSARLRWRRRSRDRQQSPLADRPGQHNPPPRRRPPHWSRCPVVG